jgi:hypothetical protein
MYDFVKAVVESDYRLAREWYCIERPDSSALNRRFGPEWELANRQQWQQGHPEAENYRLVVMSLLCQPPENCDQYPNANFNVFLDLQMQYLATAEAFKGTRGLQGYNSLYCGEEQTRLFARLLRHYAMEALILHRHRRHDHIAIANDTICGATDDRRRARSGAVHHEDNSS